MPTGVQGSTKHLLPGNQLRGRVGDLPSPLAVNEILQKTVLIIPSKGQPFRGGMSSTAGSAWKLPCSLEHQENTSETSFFFFVLHHNLSMSSRPNISSSLLMKETDKAASCCLFLSSYSALSCHPGRPHLVSNTPPGGDVKGDTQSLGPE